MISLIHNQNLKFYQLSCCNTYLLNIFTYREISQHFISELQNYDKAELSAEDTLSAQHSAAEDSDYHSASHLSVQVQLSACLIHDCTVLKLKSETVIDDQKLHLHSITADLQLSDNDADTDTDRHC
ncbi:hypothetical protein EMCG_07553 [[Emmonsia] crescens]|uniref:Uncharacterized protein n=1 Tax=[Emmonsia] crescens TaxID=73230 RepID=A0A0G2J5I1_9EURO|nr:hypothetical protein EMCG_07553 [Emmonsia crescens UAMH 3008]